LEEIQNPTLAEQVEDLKAQVQTLEMIISEPGHLWWRLQVKPIPPPPRIKKRKPILAENP
jgi:hypothetical protein